MDKLGDQRGSTSAITRCTDELELTHPLPRTGLTETSREPGLRDQTTHSSRFFNRIGAQGWHKSEFFTYTWKYPALRRWLVAQLLPREKLILSIGCGSGEIERDISKRKRTIVGVDISHRMLAIAARRGVKNLVQTDATSLPFPRGCLNLVMFMESAGYFELNVVLREVKRVLSKSGRLIMTTYPPHHNSDSLCRNVSLSQVARAVRGAGFKILDHQMLAVNRLGVAKVASEDQSVILYTVAQKP